ncbi:unnamed protein product, partial [Mesorhabditis belari]|uniref:L-Fucosyltransferase n=1 Tax=Mesorhabditis belari TaxID=2138241 RepID=A0AAF3JBT0_9BILA
MLLLSLSLFFLLVALFKADPKVCTALYKVIDENCPANAVIQEILNDERPEPTKRESNWGIVDTDRLLISRSQAFEVGTGLGNRLFAVMSTFGIANKLNRQAIFPARHELCTWHCIEALWEISTLFPGLIPEKAIDVSARHTKNLYDELVINECCLYIDPFKRHFPIQQQQQTLRFYGSFIQSYKYFIDYQDEYEPILKSGLKAFAKLSASMAPIEVIDPGATRICLHTRRGGFTGDFHQASNPTFLRNTIQHFSKPKNRRNGIKKRQIKEFNVVKKSLFQTFFDLSHGRKKRESNDDVQFLLFGDDVDWLRSIEAEMKILNPNLHIVDQKGSPPVATWHFFSQYCDKVVITASSSTFGWWAAYFSQLGRPNVEVYYNKRFAKSAAYLTQQKDEDFFLPNWIPLDLENGNDKRK